LAKAYFEGKIMNLLEAKVDYISVEEQLRSLIKQDEVQISVIYEGRSVIKRGDVPPVASIILEGFVDDQYDKERILAICGAFVSAPEKIKDLIDVVNPVQVLIEGHILEMSRDNSENMGVEWGTAENTTYGDGVVTMGERSANSARFLENLYNSYHGDVEYLGPRVESENNYPWNFDNLNRVDPLYAKINFDLQRNRGKVLAAPKIITRVGSEANIRVGGEIPVFGESQSGGVTVEYKPYGLEMKIEPDVDHKGNITSKVDIVWTTIDATSAQTYGNFTYYGLRERSTSSVVTVRDGQHIIISGLVSTEEGKVFSGIPVLSKIPILGKLFSSTEFQEKKSELVIVVTPSLLASKKMRQRYKEFTTEELSKEIPSGVEAAMPNLSEIGDGQVKQLQVAMSRVNDTFDKILNRENLTITPVDMPVVKILPQDELGGDVELAASEGSTNGPLQKVSSPAMNQAVNVEPLTGDSADSFAEMIRARMRAGKSSSSEKSMTVEKRAEIQRELRERTSQASSYTVAPMSQEAKSLFPESAEGSSLEFKLKSIITEMSVEDEDVDTQTAWETAAPKQQLKVPAAVKRTENVRVSSPAQDIDSRVDSLFLKIKNKLTGDGSV
jgi:Flp pilus assembly secretin CpaC